jgi:hypothetical protein
MVYRASAQNISHLIFAIFLSKSKILFLCPFIGFRVLMAVFEWFYVQFKVFRPMILMFFLANSPFYDHTKHFPYVILLCG